MHTQMPDGRSRAAPIRGGLCLLLMLAMYSVSVAQETNVSVLDHGPFPKGDLAPEHNTGKVWVHFLVQPDGVYTTAVGRESFAPGARTYWHSHPAGEILMVIEGTGYHKIEGEPIETIRKGDVVRCPPGIRHWHGAHADSAMAHLIIVPNTEKGMVVWGKEVDRE